MARKHRLFALIAGWLILSAPASADLIAGQTAFAAKDYAEAFRQLLPVARAGDPRAQYLLGQMSEYDFEPVPYDPRQAVRWYRNAAAQEHGDAQYALSRAYAHGTGVRPSRGEAIAWLERAAENDSVLAMLELAERHERREGLRKDPARATELIRRAALLGSAEAQYRYAERLDAGLGTPQDPRAAWQWYRRAAENGHPAALQRVGRTGRTASATLDDVVALWLAMAAQRKALPHAPMRVMTSN